MFAPLFRENGRWIYLPVYLILAFLLVGCESRVGTPYIIIDRALPCETTSIDLAILYEAADNSSDMFSEEFWESASSDGRPLCVAHPTIQPPSLDCYFFYSKSTTNSNQVFPITCEAGSVQYYDSSWEYRYEGPTPEWFKRPSVFYIAHVISCSTADPIKGQVVYVAPAFNTDWWDMPEIWAINNIIKIPSQIIVDDVQVVLTPNLGYERAMRVTISGHIENTGESCADWEAPNGDVYLAISRWNISSTASPQFTLVRFLPELYAGQLYTYHIRYPGNQAYAPSEISGTFLPPACNERYISLEFDRIGTVLAAEAFPVSITIRGHVYDQNDCERIDLTEGSVVLATDDGTTCQIEFVSGVGNCDLVFNTSGSHTITASYDGGGLFSDATATTEVTVEKLSSATEIVYHFPDPAIAGQQLQVKVEVTGLGPIPTGEVLVSAGGGDCTIQLVDGQGSCALTPVFEGSTTITAEYEGDETYNPSSTTSDATVGPAIQTTVTNFTTIDAYLDGTCISPKPVYVTVRVRGLSGTPTGTVYVTGADVQNCQITLAGGTGSCTLYFNSYNHAGTPIYATYNGDANFLGSSTSGTFSSCQ